MLIFNWLNFLIDIPSFESWLKSNFENYFHLMTTSTNFKVAFMSPGTPEQRTAIAAHLATLTEQGEAAKRALPSRRIGVPSKHEDQVAFEKAVKDFIATKTWDQMTVAEKKFAMSGALTNAEYDTLTVS